MKTKVECGTKRRETLIVKGEVHKILEKSSKDIPLQERLNSTGLNYVIDYQLRKNKVHQGSDTFLKTILHTSSIPFKY